MSKEIEVHLNHASLQKAIRELKQYEIWVKQKSDQLGERLAQFVGTEVSIGFAQAFYIGEKDISIDVRYEGGMWVVEANGKNLFFIEFGAGVHYNGSEPYPIDRPAGVVKIGEYGKGLGKRDFWFAPEIGYTQGTPAQMPMYRSFEDAKRELKRIAEEVFKG